MSIGRVISISMIVQLPNACSLSNMESYFYAIVLGFLLGYITNIANIFTSSYGKGGGGGAYLSSPRARSKGTPYRRIPDRTKS